MFGRKAHKTTWEHLKDEQYFDYFQKIKKMLTFS